MGYSCKERCKIWAIRAGQGRQYYDKGRKYCSICSKWLLYEGRYCPCCGNRLRHRGLKRRGGVYITPSGAGGAA